MQTLIKRTCPVYVNSGYRLGFCSPPTTNSWRPELTNAALLIIIITNRLPSGNTMGPVPVPKEIDPHHFLYLYFQYSFTAKHPWATSIQHPFSDEQSISLSFPQCDFRYLKCLLFACVFIVKSTSSCATFNRSQKLISDTRIQMCIRDRNTTLRSSFSVTL